MKYQLVGNVAGTEDATLKASVTYLNDYRDPDGHAPPPVLLFEKRPGQEWTSQPDGGPAWVWGPGQPGDPSARVRVAYTVERPGLPPFGRVLERRILPNTSLPGYWDFTLPDSQQPAWNGGGGSPTPVEVLPGQGPPGEPGAGLLLGSGAPAPGAGRRGDTYLDTTTWDVYHRAPDWALVGNIRGGTGGAGPRGADGLGVPRGGSTGRWLYFGTAGPEWRQPRLTDLADVDLGTAPTNGQALVWSRAAQKWQPGSVQASTPTGLVVNTEPDGSLSSPDPRITPEPDGSLSAPDTLTTVNSDGSLSEV
ncbi:hypothetical protein D3875_02635 [Deinococcus cavernae]|uniref:Uncharacterized protein n=1 Tax=Deinococcus cavernae TaxID=2320857 RepID=A0A418VFM3_9DEIO|nr:hypothetical protein [Deinococcus cavernae]RJF74909.1 hypothetical protein D3875_02635 [Deinococcus cavernae]